MSSRIPKVLSIAGFDPTSGAGVVSDVKTIEALGGYGLAVVTCIAIQDTRGVVKILPLDPQDVAMQIDVIVNDVAVDGVKVGALPNEYVIDVVADRVSKLGVPLVLDPVLAPTKGPRFLEGPGIEALRERLLPIATLVTPNVKEAEELLGKTIDSEEKLVEAARAIVEELGTKAALIKGFKCRGEVLDALYVDDGTQRIFSRKDLGFDVHGLGCVLSSAIATYLAMGMKLIEAVEKGIEYAIYVARTSLHIGSGRPCPNHLAKLKRDSYVLNSLKSIKEALALLERNSDVVANLVPEVGMNIVEAPPYPLATSIEDCVGVEGRIHKVGTRIKPCGCIWMGVSSHVARAILEAQKLDPSIRACANIKPFNGIEEIAKELGLEIVFVDRREEPKEIKEVEGASIPWIVREAYRIKGAIPDVIYDRGDVGKEPMARVFGKSAVEVAKKIVAMGKALKARSTV